MIAEQLFSMEAPESTRGTQDISKVVFNKDQVAAKLDISKDDVAHAHRLSRALGVAGAVCPERGPMLREMQTGLSEAIEVTADTFTEGTSLRIATWSSRAQTVSLSVFPAVEVPNNLREIIRTGASRTSPFGSSSAIGKEKKLYTWEGLLRYEDDTSKAHAPMGPVAAQHNVQSCLEYFLGPL